MNRLLSLDGGGARGLFTLQVLARMEETLAVLHNRPAEEFRLCHYFNFIGGTSTGAIIAVLLSLGHRVQDVIRFYRSHLGDIFRPVHWRGWWRAYDGTGLKKMLCELLVDQHGRPLTLGSEELRSWLLVILRNSSTGSVWPLTNHPEARYSRRSAPGQVTNLDLPLWQVVRASAAAPTFFPSESVTFEDPTTGPVSFEFIDGGVSPHNNPALALFTQATAPPYRFSMATGPDKMFIVSIGTGAVRQQYAPGEFARINRLGGALRTLRSLMQSLIDHPDFVCRTLGWCVHGHVLDSEFGDMVTESPRPGAAFRYCRYQHWFTAEEIETARRQFGSRAPFALDDSKSIPLLEKLGASYAASHVQPEHFPPGELSEARVIRG